VPINRSAVNLWAVLVAGLGTFFLGALWYSALFGKVWVKLQGYTEEQLTAMKAKMSPAVFFGGMLVADLLLALVVALLVVAFDVTGPVNGAILGFFLWLGPAACIGLMNHLPTQKPVGAYLIDVGYQLAFLVPVGAILAGWR
jgi:hypothetical protein